MTDKAEANQVVVADVVIAADVAEEAIDTSETIGTGAAAVTDSKSGCCKIVRPMSLANKAKANEAAVPFSLIKFSAIIVEVKEYVGFKINNKSFRTVAIDDVC